MSARFSPRCRRLAPMPLVSAPPFMVRLVVRNDVNRWCWRLSEGSDTEVLTPGGDPWRW